MSKYEHPSALVNIKDGDGFSVAITCSNDNEQLKHMVLFRSYFDSSRREELFVEGVSPKADNILTIKGYCPSISYSDDMATLVVKVKKSKHCKYITECDFSIDNQLLQKWTDYCKK